MTTPRVIRLKELERVIQLVPFFRNPSVRLEQYATPSTLAARLLWLAETVYSDIYSRSVLDLGAGTGRLGIGAAYMGAHLSVLVEIDVEALSLAREAARRLGLSNVGFVLADARLPPFRPGSFDTVVENPPFGVHRRGADIEFLRSAALVGCTVYTIHKKTTLRYVVNRAREYGCSDIEVIYEDRICIPHLFQFHKKRVHCVDIVVLRLDCRGVCGER